MNDKIYLNGSNVGVTGFFMICFKGKKNNNKQTNTHTKNSFKMVKSRTKIQQAYMETKKEKRGEKYWKGDERDEKVLCFTRLSDRSLEEREKLNSECDFERDYVHGE